MSQQTSTSIITKKGTNILKAIGIVSATMVSCATLCGIGIHILGQVYGIPEMRKDVNDILVKCDLQQKDIAEIKTILKYEKNIKIKYQAVSYPSNTVDSAD